MPDRDDFEHRRVDASTAPRLTPKGDSSPFAMGARYRGEEPAAPKPRRVRGPDKAPRKPRATPTPAAADKARQRPARASRAASVPVELAPVSTAPTAPPPSTLRCALFNTGDLHIETDAGRLLLTRGEARELVKYLDQLMKSIEAQP